MTVCDGSCEPSCSYGCELRKKNLMVAPSAMPTRMNDKPPPTADPAWERGIVTQERPDGSRMPLLQPNSLEPMRVKQHGENRRNIEAQLRNLHTRTTPLPS